MLKAILLPRRNPEHHYEEKSYVTTPRGGRADAWYWFQLSEVG